LAKWPRLIKISGIQAMCSFVAAKGISDRDKINAYRQIDCTVLPDSEGTTRILQTLLEMIKATRNLFWLSHKDPKVQRGSQTTNHNL
jgi:hypothetical protein